MKLVFAIVHDEDTRNVCDELNNGGFSVTKLSSSGGFLKAGNTTLLVGVEQEKVDDVLAIIERESNSRKEYVNSVGTMNSMGTGMFMPTPVEVTVGGATVFVIDVDTFKKL